MKTPIGQDLGDPKCKASFASGHVTGLAHVHHTNQEAQTNFGVQNFYLNFSMWTNLIKSSAMQLTSSLALFLSLEVGLKITGSRLQLPNYQVSLPGMV